MRRARPFARSATRPRKPSSTVASHNSNQRRAHAQDGTEQIVHRDLAVEVADELRDPMAAVEVGQPHTCSDRASFVKGHAMAVRR
jgi:hypothetical protein